MRLIIGMALIIIGITAGLYLGVWWAFIGGIIQIIDQIKAPDTESLQVAFGAVRILSAGIIGWASAILFVAFGLTVIKNPG